ncbi:MAG: hypothetical protein MZU91_05930 [Desulfosudis oleivorans]|nr:hypothetical protein [Desulfosudis oleivorans]
MVSVTSSVIRDNCETEIPVSELVPGDIIRLSAGFNSADVRLISSKELTVNQSSLTGESLPVEKHRQPEILENKTLFELSNLCFLGNNVISGGAIAVVILTGNQTYLGSIAEKLTAPRELTSFDRGISSFTWLMIKFLLL